MWHKQILRLSDPEPKLSDISLVEQAVRALSKGVSPDDIGNNFYRPIIPAPDADHRWRDHKHEHKTEAKTKAFASSGKHGGAGHGNGGLSPLRPSERHSRP